MTLNSMDGSDVLFESVLWALRSNQGTDQHRLSYFGKSTPTQSKSMAHFLKFTEEWEERTYQEHELEMVRWRREQMALEGYSIAKMDTAEYKPEMLQNESNIACYWERFL